MIAGGEQQQSAQLFGNVARVCLQFFIPLTAHAAPYFSIMAVSRHRPAFQYEQCSAHAMHPSPERRQIASVENAREIVQVRFRVLDEGRPQRFLFS
jgi:hypothetical protein